MIILFNDFDIWVYGDCWWYFNLILGDFLWIYLIFLKWIGCVNLFYKNFWEFLWYNWEIMSGWWVGGKFFLEYNIVLLGDLGVGKLGEMFYFNCYRCCMGFWYFFLMCRFLFIIYFCKWCRNNWFIRSGICKSISDLY